MKSSPLGAALIGLLVLSGAGPASGAEGEPPRPCPVRVTEAAAIPMPETALRRITGHYRSADGREYVVARSAGRAYLLLPDGGYRALSRAGDGFRMGASLLDEAGETEVRFLGPGPGGAGALVLRDRGEEIRAERVDLYREVPAAFDVSGNRMAARAFLPLARTEAAVVLVPGSGPGDRHGPFGLYDLVGRTFAAAGVAAIGFDKRGVGDSEGDWRREGFEDLARDVLGARAALERLAPDEEGRELPRGSWGISQAGWILAALLRLDSPPGDDFAILVSAAGVTETVAEQNLWNVLAEIESAGLGSDASEAARRAWKGLVATVGGAAVDYDPAREEDLELGVPASLLPPPRRGSELPAEAWFSILDLDFDPEPIWRAYPGRLLLLYGAKDRATPTGEIVREVRRWPARDGLCLQVFPHGNHLLLDAETGSATEYGELSRYVEGYPSGMVEWLLGRRCRDRM